MNTSGGPISRTTSSARSPKFHGELDRIWREGVLKGMNPEVDAKRISRADGCRRAIEAPRGHAKSTTFTFKDDLHAAVYGYKHYIIILSDSSEQAEGFLVDIKTELEENAALKEDFGELEGKVWKSSVILLANGSQELRQSARQEDPWPTSQAVASRPYRLRRSGERRERQHAGATQEAPRLVL